jgi:hypothetical protein
MLAHMRHRPLGLIGAGLIMLHLAGQGGCELNGAGIDLGGNGGGSLATAGKGGDRGGVDGAGGQIGAGGWNGTGGALTATGGRVGIGGSGGVGTGGSGSGGRATGGRSGSGGSVGGGGASATGGLIGTGGAQGAGGRGGVTGGGGLGGEVGGSGGTMGSGGIMGSGGALGGGGTAGNGVGGNGGSVCIQIAAQYQAQMLSAKSCENAARPCQIAVALLLGCNCETHVQTAARLNILAAAWTTAGCESFCPFTCTDPQPGYCDDETALCRDTPP